MAYTDYRIIKSHLLNVQDDVQAAIADGWQPLGGPIQHLGDPHKVFQAMVKGTGESGGGGSGVQLPTGTNGQVLKHNGTTWAAGTDANTTYVAATTTVAGLMAAADKVKLDGVATSATANDTDANLKNRANHTGTQAISTITNLQTTLDAKATAAALTALDARVAALESA